MDMNPVSTSTITPAMPPRELAAVVRQASRDVAMLRARAHRIPEVRGASRSVAASALDEALALCSHLLQELANADVQIQRKAREAQAEREHRDALFDQLPVACLRTDDAGWITRANRAAALMLRVSAKHLAEKPLLHFTVDRPEFMQLLQRLRHEQRKHECVLSLRPREHATIRRSVTLTPDPDGGWLWFFGADGPRASSDVAQVSCSQP